MKNQTVKPRKNDCREVFLKKSLTRNENHSVETRKAVDQRFAFFL